MAAIVGGARERNSEPEAAVIEAADGPKEAIIKMSGKQGVRVGIPEREYVEKLHIERYQAGESIDNIGFRNKHAMVTGTTVRAWFKHYNLPVARDVEGRYWRPSVNGNGHDHEPQLAAVNGREPEPTTTEALAAEAPAAEDASTAAGQAADELLAEIADEPADEPAAEPTATEAVEAAVQFLTMYPDHPDYGDWKKGHDVATNGNGANGELEPVRTQTLAPLLLSELAKLAKSGGVHGRISVQLDLTFEIGGMN